MPSIIQSVRFNTNLSAKVEFVQSPSNPGALRRVSVLMMSALTVLLVTSLLVNNALAQTPPPILGQETKGTPALDEKAPLPKVERTTADKESESTNTQDKASSLFGTATITESRRENGQLYEIELDHSLGGKQYIQENDSDGKIESTSNDLEETPNLPKWKLGSW